MENFKENLYAGGIRQSLLLVLALYLWASVC